MAKAAITATLVCCVSCSYAPFSSHPQQTQHGAPQYGNVLPPSSPTSGAADGNTTEVASAGGVNPVLHPAAAAASGQMAVTNSHSTSIQLGQSVPASAPGAMSQTAVAAAAATGSEAAGTQAGHETDQHVVTDQPPAGSSAVVL